MDSNEVFAIIYSENNDPPLTPSYHAKDCLGNGEHEGVDYCCDECDYYLDCFPDWKELLD